MFMSSLIIHEQSIYRNLNNSLLATSSVQMTVSVQSVEVYLESESVDNSPGHPVLALTVSAVLQLFEWTGEVSKRRMRDRYRIPSK